VGAIFFDDQATEEMMLGFRESAAVASAIGLLAFPPSSALVAIDPRELSSSELTFESTFKGVDRDGETLVWSSDGPESKTGFVMRIVPLGSAASSAESVWPVSAMDVAGTVDVLPLTSSR
jgi:hypothetical protein